MKKPANPIYIYIYKDLGESQTKEKYNLITKANALWERGR